MSGEEELRQQAREGTARFMGGMADHRCQDLMALLFACISTTGISPSKLYMTRSPGGGDPALGGIVFALVTKMSDQDMRRFADMARAFLQDLATEPGVLMKMEVKVDELPKGDDA